MHPKCIAAVQAAAGGRQISAGKLNAIEDAIKSKTAELARRARKDPAEIARWRALTPEQRMTEAAVAAMQDVQAEAALKVYRASLQVLREAETATRIAEQRALPGTTLSESQGLVRDIENTALHQHAVRDEAISGLTDLIDAAENRDGTGALRNLGMRIFDLDNPAMTADVVREVFGLADGRTGNVAAKKAAEAWLSTIESLRQRFNAAGGNIGKLGYGYLSQAHDAVRVAGAGPQAWAAKVLPLLDREQYVRPDGSLMDDAEVTKLLEAAHETIASEGDNKVAPGSFTGSGARANRGADHRVLHFKDGDAWMAYMKEYGEGSLYDAMMGHIGKMARDIGLIERYGPNPEKTYRIQSDIAERADGAGSMANRGFLNKPEAYWSIITGKSGTPENRVIAQVGNDVRNVQTAAKLGGATLSAISDVGTVAATLNYHKLPYFDMLANIGRRLKPGSEEADFLRAHGVIAESLASSMNRWTGDNMTHSLTGRVAKSVMKMSLMNAWTDGLRGAFAATMMQNFAKKLGTAWGNLSEWDRYLMQRKGITEADWNVITKAKATDRNGHGYLTHDAIMATGDPGAQQAATKWMGFVSDESQFAVLNPDLATRALVTAGGMPAGTVHGEAARAFFQFKSFPTAMITRHWRRILETPQGLEGAPLGFGAKTAGGAAMNKAATLAALNVSLMALGAIVLQTKALTQGKDPFDMTEGKFWTRSLTQGGGLGYVGDLLFKDPTEWRGNTFEQAAGSAFGPAAGAAAGLALDLGLTNAWQAALGKQTHFGAEALRWTNSNLPYANLWQTRALWERSFLNQAQEMLSPGYLARMQQRAQRDWGQGFWWAPGERLPERLPDFARAAGQ